MSATSGWTISFALITAIGLAIIVFGAADDAGAAGEALSNISTMDTTPNTSDGSGSYACDTVDAVYTYAGYSHGQVYLLESFPNTAFWDHFHHWLDELLQPITKTKCFTHWA